ncbi:helix-turn-helix domain-containing protein [Ensifer aridi]|uniref:helix-turn-helix domain-containing protein n=1 Tax=Ensifer aridi TaxID=1708715 RepID=UPI00054DD92B|nr:helix-turn-helix domain-containing protein [Ensifer aridi]
MTSEAAPHQFSNGLASYQLLRPAEAAKILGVSVQHLHALTIHGEIRYVNVGAGAKREVRRYRAQDVQAFVEERTRTGNVRWSTRPPLEITDADLLAAAKVVARDRKRREREKEQEAFQAKRREQREARVAWLKQCEDEATAIRERLWRESLQGKRKGAERKNDR